MIRSGEEHWNLGISEELLNFSGLMNGSIVHHNESLLSPLLILLLQLPAQFLQKVHEGVGIVSSFFENVEVPSIVGVTENDLQSFDPVVRQELPLV